MKKKHLKNIRKIPRKSHNYIKNSQTHKLTKNTFIRKRRCLKRTRRKLKVRINNFNKNKNK